MTYLSNYNIIKIFTIVWILKKLEGIMCLTRGIVTMVAIFISIFTWGYYIPYLVKEAGIFFLASKPKLILEANNRPTPRVELSTCYFPGTEDRFKVRDTVERVARAGGLSEWHTTIAVWIACEESRFHRLAVGDLKLGVSLGALQINRRAHPQIKPACSYDPVCATKFLVALVQEKERNFCHWSVFSNKFPQECPHKRRNFPPPNTVGV